MNSAEELDGSKPKLQLCSKVKQVAAECSPLYQSDKHTEAPSDVAVLWSSCNYTYPPYSHLGNCTTQ